MPLGSGYANEVCSIAKALEVVGERWTLLIVRDCLYGVSRFSDLQRHLGLPRAVLAARLDTLVSAGVLTKSAERPAAGYHLTERGEELWPVIQALYNWGEKHVTSLPRRRVFQHVSCSVDLGADGRCTRCGVSPDVADIAVVPGRDLGDGPEPTEPVSRALRAPHRLLTPLLG